MCVVGKMSKDIGMGVSKGTVVSFVPTLFGCFLGIPSLYVSKMLFCDLLQLFFWGGRGGVGWGYTATDGTPICMYSYSGSGDRLAKQ